MLTVFGIFLINHETIAYFANGLADLCRDGSFDYATIDRSLKKGCHC